jgi:hypothetical protein
MNDIYAIYIEDFNVLKFSIEMSNIRSNRSPLRLVFNQFPQRQKIVYPSIEYMSPVSVT